MRSILLGSSLLLLTLSALFGFLNNSKVRGLRQEVETADIARRAAENARIAQQKQHAHQASKPAAASSESQNRIAKAESDLIKTQSEKAALQARLETNEAEMTRMQRRLQELTAKSAEITDSSPPGTEDLQAQLEETRQQLDSAEKEKSFLASRIQKASEPAAVRTEERPARRRGAPPPGVHGTIMAVNNAYNFVVLNLGGRNGVETNAEMLVLRSGTLIGKIRVSSVEPATAIGDIMSSTLARGVRVQPGDTVIYAGTDS